MKKIVILLLSLFFLPFSVLAYSDKIILGGDSIGIEVNTNGVMVIGFYEINGKYNRGVPTIKSGDYILKVNNHEVNSINELASIIEKSSNKEYVDLIVKSGSKLKNVKLDLIIDNGIYKTGLFVKESITGIGTLTYIDPETEIFGALGHEIVESNSNNLVEIKSGKIFASEITSIDKSSKGIAGSKNAKFYYQTKYGDIAKNTIYGIFGKASKLINNEYIPVAQSNEIKIGAAKIYTVINKDKIEWFNINIKSINETSDTKNIVFEISDDSLLNKTGGIVQGMSGSPIVQNGKIIGCVTHVIVDNPINGYGIFITTMLEEGEK